MTLICRTRGKEKRSFTMTGLSEKEYKKLELMIKYKSKKDFIITRCDLTFKIGLNEVEAYGNIDFNDGSDDMKELHYFDWFDSLNERGVVIPANYDYKTHTAKSDIKRIKQFDTLQTEKILQYYHGVLGKPKYTLIFREDK